MENNKIEIQIKSNIHDKLIKTTQMIVLYKNGEDNESKATVLTQCDLDALRNFISLMMCSGVDVKNHTDIPFDIRRDFNEDMIECMEDYLNQLKDLKKMYNELNKTVKN